MPRVIATFENASESINGHRFTRDRGQMISDDLPDDVAAHFASIPGFRLVEEQKRGPGRPRKLGQEDPQDEGQPE